MRRGIIILLLIFCNCVWWNVASRREIREMKREYVNRYGGKPDLWPTVVGLWYDMVDIFSVPVDNAVGTNSLYNAITLLRFCGDGIEYDVVRKDFIGEVGGGEAYVGLFSDSWIGYTQGRGFLLFNVKNGSFVDHIVTYKMSEWLKGVAFTGRKKFEFIFEVETDRDERYLRIVDFDGTGKFKVLSELKIGKAEVGSVRDPWTIHNGIIFVYNDDSVKIRAYDMNFKEIQHPFCDIFNNLKGFRCLQQFVIHPNLPIAILVERDRYEGGLMKVYLVKWEEKDEKKRVVELLKNSISIFTGSIKFSVSKFEFSPDGRWLVFRDNTDYKSEMGPVFMAIPVNGELEFPLGKAKVLGTMLRENARVASTAWIKKPLSYVVSDWKALYKWELDKLKREFFEEVK